MDLIVRGNIDRYLDLIEEVVCEPEAYGIDAPDLEEAAERILRSLGTDWKANEEAILDRMRAELREWRRDRPEVNFLRRCTNWKTNEGLHMARATVDESGLMMIGFRLPNHCWPTSRTWARGIPNGSTQPCRQSWQLSGCPPSECAPAPSCESTSSAPGPSACTSTLSCASARSSKSVARTSPPMLTQWRTEVASAHRRCPDRKPLPPHRPVELDLAPRDLKIQITIAVLERLGVPPRGSPYSGCSIVTEVLEDSEDNEGLAEETVARIWNHPFQREIQKHSKAIAELTGLSELHSLHSTEA